MAKRKTELELSLIDNVTRGLRNIEKGVSGLGASLVKINQAADLAGRAISAIDTVTGFSAAITSARAFETALQQVRAVTGSSVEELEKLRDAAEEASANSVFSATEAAEGLAELARAGLTANDAIATLNPTLQLAQGQNLSVAASAELVATTLTQFGLAAGESGRIADVLAKSADSTATSVEQLGNALGYTAPLARQLGLTVEDTTALLGGLANAGFRGERAGTALRNVFSALLDPASKFGTALRQAGIESTDLADVFDQLGQRADKGKSVILALDAEARPAILALAQQGGAALRVLQKDLEDSAGTAERTAGLYGETFDGAAAKFANAIDRIRRTVATPILEGISDDITRLADRLQEFAQTPAFEEITRKIGEFASKGADAIVNLVENFDFDAAVQAAQRFAEDTRVVFEAISATAGFVVASIRAVGEAYTALRGTTSDLIEENDQFLALLARAVPQINALRTAYELASAAQGENAETARQSTEATANLADRFRALVAPVQAAVAAFEQVRASVEAVQLETVKVTPTLKDYEEALLAAARAGDDNAVASFSAKIRELKGELQGAGDQALTTAQQLADLKVQLIAAVEAGNAGEIARIASEYRAVDAAAKEVEATVEKLIGTQKAAGDAAKNLGTQTQSAAQAVKQSADGAKEAELAYGKLADTGAKATGAAAAIASRIRALRQEFSFSAAAADLFEQQLEKVNRRFLGSALSTSIGAYVSALEAGASATRRAVEAQAELADEIEAGLDIAPLQGDLEATIEQLRGLEGETRSATGQFRLLSEQRLDKLRSEINATISAIERQQQAVQALLDIQRQQQDEADRRAGNEEDIAERQYQDELRRIAELEAAGGASAKAAAEEARRLAKENHEADLREIRQRGQEERAQAEQTSTTKKASREQERAERARDRETEAAASAGGAGRGAVPAPITINVDYRPELGDLGNEEGLRRLARRLQPIADDIRRRSL